MPNIKGVGVIERKFKTCFTNTKRPSSCRAESCLASPTYAIPQMGLLGYEGGALVGFPGVGSSTGAWLGGWLKLGEYTMPGGGEPCWLIRGSDLARESVHLSINTFDAR